ncbi:MAG: thiamine pyrophosphate-dependent dehydrogenase E1 component subunit alpha [Anaerolineae bacterium]|nr:thiamine pyrophosphate-dependent dehydrogenase E1 component subunit alpha [Anaerolineae bacterium]
MAPDLWTLYPLMLRSRLFEQAIADLWRDGLISGEMHLGTGEEAIIAGVVSQLQDGDAMALDHRGTAALLMRGVDPGLILRELLGRATGLCGGVGGHMHLFSRDHLAASSGIVGASGPAATGFALAAQALRPGTIAIAFFGEGAMNQGMLMESLNLASVWALPVVFVCKDDGWAITTQSASATGGSLSDRAHGFGVPAVEVDGRDVSKVWSAVHSAIERARSGGGPTFLHAQCVHLEGHFMGFQLLRSVRDPLGQVPAIALPLTQSFLRPGGAPLRERVAGLMHVAGVMRATQHDPRQDLANDPVPRVRQALLVDPERLLALEDRIAGELVEIVASALGEVSP